MPAFLQWNIATIPPWLLIQMAEDPVAMILPHQSLSIHFQNDHDLSTMALVDSVNKYEHLSQESLKYVGRYLDFPPNDPKMQIYCVLEGTLTWTMATNIFQKTSQPSVDPSQTNNESATYFQRLLEGANRGALAQKTRNKSITSTMTNVSVSDAVEVSSSQGIVDSTSTTTTTNKENNSIPFRNSMKLTSDFSVGKYHKKILSHSTGMVQQRIYLPIVCSLTLN
jgi:hypothetical protein